ncbi:hypothetical protein C5612_29675 [Pseudomonas frederiksbergensis]|uniref:Uncharacterized protein n=1 Tax=Pseudomonas frederiksbergensis TaxID=104087 RepID=A0A2S8H4S5_9PSED|nr:hypothetical protein C5612_29675 [Pseudomonas frederiksbergensis]
MSVDINVAGHIAFASKPAPTLVRVGRKKWLTEIDVEANHACAAVTGCCSGLRNAVSREPV